MLLSYFGSQGNIVWWEEMSLGARVRFSTWRLTFLSRVSFLTCKMEILLPMFAVLLAMTTLRRVSGHFGIVYQSKYNQKHRTTIRDVGQKINYGD